VPVVVVVEVAAAAAVALPARAEVATISRNTTNPTTFRPAAALLQTTTSPSNFATKTSI
jgi:hypothetical protein